MIFAQLPDPKSFEEQILETGDAIILVNMYRPKQVQSLTSFDESAWKIQFLVILGSRWLSDKMNHPKRGK